MEIMKKKKILYVITKSNWGGAQSYVYDLATKVPEKFEKVVALGGNGPLKEKLEKADIRTISLPWLARDVNPFRDFLVFKKLISLFKEEKPDIIHLNSSKIGALGALAGRIAKVPNIIFTAHGWAFREERPQWQKTIIKLLSWCTMLWSHKIITVSKRDAREASDFAFVKKKIILIHNGIPEITFLESSEAKKILLEKESTNSLWVGTIGELHKNKGHKYAIEALALIQRKHEVMFFIIGEGEERRTLEKMIADLDLSLKVVLFAKKESAAMLLSAFDIFLFPSIKEGLPYAILEAGQAGLPVIASAVGGIPEIITDMESGILIRPKSSEEIVKAFDYLLSHPKEAANFGKKLRANVKKNFSFKKMLRETVEAYEI